MTIATCLFIIVPQTPRTEVSYNFMDFYFKPNHLHEDPDNLLIQETTVTVTTFEKFRCDHSVMSTHVFIFRYYRFVWINCRSKVPTVHNKSRTSLFLKSDAICYVQYQGRQ